MVELENSDAERRSKKEKDSLVGLIITLVVSLIILILWLATRETRDSNPSPFLDKIGCRFPKVQVSLKNIPQQDDDDDTQLANVYYQFGAWGDDRYQAQSLNQTSKDHEFFQSETIKVTKKNQNRWIKFKPVDAVLDEKWCAKWFFCSYEKFENWRKWL